MIKKNELKQNSVSSDKFHVGIELELIVPGSDESSHDDEACYDAYRENLESEGVSGILRNYVGLSRDAANSIESYFDVDQWIFDYMQDWSCDDCDCPYNSDNGPTRKDIESQLTQLTGNRSIKVVADASINTEDSEIDAEVCWNYCASKDQIEDNAKILKAMTDMGARFDKSCGLHINLNNFLNITKRTVDTMKLDFLFNVVAKSRRDSTYCNQYAIAHDQKYSMIYHQGDRLEFRFFSPTLEADKLNHYVTLAHVVYCRLAGKTKKLPKKTEVYLYNKMVIVNKLSPSIAKWTIAKINSIGPIANYSSSVESEDEAA